MSTPPEKVAEAMPGTLAELSFLTGYPVGEVVHQITNLRRAGVRVNAVAEPGAIGVRYPIEPDVLSTRFEIALDDSSSEE